MNPPALPQVTVLPCLAIVIPIRITLFRAELLSAGMHNAVLAQYLAIRLTLWIVVNGPPTIVASNFKISANHNQSI